MPFLKRGLVLQRKEIRTGRQHPRVDTDLNSLKVYEFRTVQNLLKTSPENIGTFRQIILE
jgi:hypothetical protein